MRAFIQSLVQKHVKKCQNRIDAANRERLTNRDFTLICSNCAGGILYHNLGLQFRSPFINLYMSNEDFLFALEHWQEFLATELLEDVHAGESYPVGIGYGGVKIHFMHYRSFEDAVVKWNARKNRIDMNHAAVMLTNFGGDYAVLERFEKLPYAHKVAFTREEYPEFESVVCLKGFKQYAERMEKNDRGGVPNIWFTQSRLTGRRFIDQFDYVSFFNGLK